MNKQRRKTKNKENNFAVYVTNLKYDVFSIGKTSIEADGDSVFENFEEAKRVAIELFLAKHPDFNPNEYDDDYVGYSDHRSKYDELQDLIQEDCQRIPDEFLKYIINELGEYNYNEQI